MTIGTVGGRALQGATMGAAIGSLVPIIGTAIGAAVGGIGGAVAGAIEGKKSLDVAKKEADADAAAANKNPQLVQSNGYLSALVDLLGKQNKAIIGTSQRAATSYNKGDIQRGLVRALNAQIV